MTTFQSSLLLFLGLILIILFLRYLKNGELTFTSNYFEQRVYVSTNDIIKNQILDALKESGFIKIKYQNESFNAIALPTIWSFSEKINVKIVQKSETEFLIHFLSQCLFPLQIFDWGKNQKNSNLFFKNLDKKLRYQSS